MYKFIGIKLNGKKKYVLPAQATKYVYSDNGAVIL